jgi:hypothetical protein
MWERIFETGKTPVAVLCVRRVTMKWRINLGGHTPSLQRKTSFADVSVPVFF